MSFSRSSSSFSSVILPAAGVGSFQPGGPVSRVPPPRVKPAQDLLLLRGQRRRIHVDRHGRACQRLGRKPLPRNRAHRRVLHRDHVQNPAGEQAALLRVLHQGEFAALVHRPPFRVLLEVGQQARPSASTSPGRIPRARPGAAPGRCRTPPPSARPKSPRRRSPAGTATCVTAVFSGGRLAIHTLAAPQARMARRNPVLVSIQTPEVGPAFLAPSSSAEIPGHTPW